MTREQLHTRRRRERAERLIPLAAGVAGLLGDATWQSGAVTRRATGVAARLPDGA